MKRLIQGSQWHHTRNIYPYPIFQVETYATPKSFGKRLLFGMSLPTLRNDLSKIYEPNAPALSQRLATMQAAKQAGLNVYVVVAPTYPESDEADLRNTLQEVARSPHGVSRTDQCQGQQRATD